DVRSRRHAGVRPEDAQVGTEAGEDLHGLGVAMTVEEEPAPAREVGDLVNHRRPGVAAVQVELADAAVNAAAEALLQVCHDGGVHVPGSQLSRHPVRAEDGHDAVGRGLVKLERAVVGSAGHEGPPDSGTVEDRQHGAGRVLGPGVPAVVEMRVDDGDVGCRRRARRGDQRQESQDQGGGGRSAARHGPNYTRPGTRRSTEPGRYNPRAWPPDSSSRCWPSRPWRPAVLDSAARCPAPRPTIWSTASGTSTRATPGRAAGCGPGTWRGASGSRRFIPRPPTCPASMTNDP